MVIYLAAACVLTLVTGLLLLVSMRRATPASGTRPTEVLKDQLRQFESEVDAGRLTPDEATSLRAEFGRRLIDEDRQTKHRGTTKSGLVLPVVLALIIPALSVPAYLAKGKPELSDAPLHARLDRAVENNDIEAMVVKVEERLQQVPDDALGWKMLAPIYMQLGRFADSAVAYEQLIRLEPPTAERLANLGEALTYAEQGIVTSKAAKALSMALEKNPDDPKANFFMGLSLKQDGKTTEARQRFESVLAKSSADAPWRAAFEKELAALSAAPALTDEQVQQGSAMAARDQEKMIRGMVDGLEVKLQQDQENIEGWLRLIRARTVLGEADKARSALGKATTIFQNQTQAMASLNALAMELKLQ